jgi:GT2 family glycosyltransferase
VFVNPDTEIVAWPWTDVRVPPVDAIVGPRFTDTRRASDHSGRTYRVRDEIRRSWLRANGPVPDGTGFVSGAALLIDRAAFQRTGGFDEAYFLFYEDIDFCLRANELGIRTVVDDTWVMRHARGHSTSARFGSSLMWSFESATRFHRTHHHALRTYRCYVLVDSLARAVLHTARRDHVRRRAYTSLAGRAGRELIGG